jgi:hypothetical protein
MEERGEYEDVTTQCSSWKMAMPEREGEMAGCLTKPTPLGNIEAQAASLSGEGFWVKVTL